MAKVHDVVSANGHLQIIFDRYSHKKRRAEWLVRINPDGPSKEKGLVGFTQFSVQKSLKGFPGLDAHIINPSSDLQERTRGVAFTMTSGKPKSVRKQ